MNYNTKDGSRENLDLNIEYYYEGFCSKTDKDIKGNYCSHCGENMLRIAYKSSIFDSKEGPKTGGFFGKIKNLFIDEEDDGDEV